MRMKKYNAFIKEPTVYAPTELQYHRIP